MNVSQTWSTETVGPADVVFLVAVFFLEPFLVDFEESSSAYSVSPASASYGMAVDDDASKGKLISICFKIVAIVDDWILLSPAY
jgi:hypothetical protein